MKRSLGLGKYRDLLFAILLFIVLDLGILLFNFFASSQLERDAGRINSAGELRMLTQQLTKSVLTLQVERKAELPTQTSLAQLGQGHAGFVRSLNGLKESLAQELEFKVFGIDPAQLREPLRKLEREWGPLEEVLRPLVAGLEPSLDDVEIAVNKSVARNIRLMALCDDLATSIQAAAGTKTERMRQIQVLAIVLALINFVYIVFKFLRRLNASDQLAESARRETEDILGTVSEGLLLVRADGKLGSQFSASVPKLFMRQVQAGQDFRELLGQMLTAERAEEARSYLDLMFDPKVKPALLTQLDPLREVEVSGQGQGFERKYLTFQMSQVRDGPAVKELLVTVFDVTQKVMLERELAATQDAARSDVEDLIRVLEHEPALLQDFLVGARARLADLNQAMREVGRRPQDYLALVQEAARLVHGIKGEAAALSLTAMSRQAHRMEDVLVPLRARPDLSGDDLIPVVLELSRVQEQVDRLHRVFERVGRLGGAQPQDPPEVMQAMVANLRSLSERVARSLRKQVHLTAHIGETSVSPEVMQVLREALPQLVRNAVVHGIEDPAERATAGKPEVGQLRLEIGRRHDGQLEVVVSDDGRGIAVPVLRQRAQQSRADAASLSDSQVLGLIFDQDFSTATEVTEHAGRGVGLALVRQIVDRAGARLRVMTQPRSYTRFVLQFGGAA
jgi:HPt (histidine-containing phosphotransfer) domain-containing protein